MARDDQLLSRELPLVKELLWLIRLRWLAATAVLLGGLLTTTWATWGREHIIVIALAGGLAMYNLLMWRAMGSVEVRRDRRRLFALAWLQIVLDLVCLTLATIWTGGMSSPLRTFFVLHMVLSSLLLSPRYAYIAGGLAILILGGALWLSKQWPVTRSEMLVLGGWAAALMLTVFLSSYITNDLREHSLALREQHERLKAVLDTAADGIITIDPQGVIQSTNPAADRIFGYRAGELVGQPVTLLMPDPFRSEHDQYVQAYLRTRQAKIIGIGREVRGVRRNGEEFPLDLAVSEVPLDHRMLFTGIVRDITERKNAERELLELNQVLSRQQRAMIQQEKVAAMGQMAAGIAHEISNPLASMDSMLQLVQRHPDKFDGQTPVVLREQVARISRIVRQLTDFAHPNDAAVELRSLNDVVQGALDMVRFDHRIRRVSVVKEFDPGTGEARIMAPAVQQVLVNMVLNALDAMANVADPQLLLRTRAEGQWKVIEITDNGHGIAPENQQRIFEPFFTTKPLGQGTGLGLSISYQLLQRQGGRCEVQSTVGQGTTFRIFLPGPAWQDAAIQASNPRERPVAEHS